MALTNKDYHENKYKQIIEELVQERFDEIKELTVEVNHNGLIYYFKGNTARKTFDDSNNGIELFRKIKSGEIKLEEAKKLQNVFKSNLNKISRERNKSKEQKMALGNIRLLHESREAISELFNDYSLIAFEAKCKTVDEKLIPSVIAGVTRVAKVSDYSNLKVLSPK